MRRALTIFVLAVGIVFVTVPVPAQAGYCTSTLNGRCISDAELIGPSDLTKRQICSSIGVYIDIGTCPTPANADTRCCILVDGSCQQPDLLGQCTGVLSQASTLSCDELSCKKPVIKGTVDTTGVRFKPQIPLPGSELFNGQEIIITGATLGEYIAALYVFVVSAIGILAAVLVFYGGLMWLTAGGDRGRVQNAKEQISSALVGILLVFAAYLLLLTISPKLIRFSSLELKTVPKRIAAYETELAFDFRGATLGSVPIGDLANWLNDPTNGMKAKYGSIITPLATSQVPLDLIYAIIFVESGGRTNLKSSAGACGIMQLLPATAGKTCDELFNPNIGITAGVAYLKKLASDTCPQTAIRKDGSVAQCKPPYVQATSCINGSIDFIIPAYNGGSGANCGSVDCPGKTWWECPVNTGYQETRNYYLKVLDAQSKLKPLLP